MYVVAEYHHHAMKYNAKTIALQLLGALFYDNLFSFDTLNLFLYKCLKDSELSPELACPIFLWCSLICLIG